MTARRRNTARVVLGAAFLGLAAGGLAACDSADDDHTFYCVDQNDTIVDEDDCDDDGDGRGGFFFWAHSPRYKKGLKPGAKLPGGGSKFAYNDAAQRTAWGLPATGRVSNGTVKSSVVGKGGSGSSGGSKSSGG
ncbi:hypothetical protein [Asanoa sp. NPDC050611]|uniref:hypothetical protein n=1 Tax=Asanoa sp. NPDC050611 TaxID=3157098 RepID=UPI0033FAC4B3